MLNQFGKIVSTPDVLGGSPRLEGKRLSVGDIVSFVNTYGTLEEVMTDYELTKADIKSALEYCTLLQCKIDKPKVFCHNCTLREHINPPNISEMEEIDGTTYYGDSVYFGTKEDLLRQWAGENNWEIAQDLLLKLHKFL